MTRGATMREDPKGLIREAFRMAPIGAAECRSIFLDWALSLPDDLPPAVAIPRLLEHYAPPEDHPMTRILREGLEMAARPGRRGGARARRRPATPE